MPAHTCFAGGWRCAEHKQRMQLKSVIAASAALCKQCAPLTSPVDKRSRYGSGCHICTCAEFGALAPAGLSQHAPSQGGCEPTCCWVQELIAAQAALSDAKQEVCSKHSAAASRIAHLETQLDTVRSQQGARLQASEARAKQAETLLGMIMPQLCDHTVKLRLMHGCSTMIKLLQCRQARWHACRACFSARQA